MRPCLRHMLRLAVLLAPGLAVAEGSILTRPADCKAVMTIQKHGCEVETQLMCGSGDAAFWRSEEYRFQGLNGVSHTDQQYRLIADQYTNGEFDFIIDPTKSFADTPLTVIAKGTGGYAQVGTLSMFGLTKPVSLTATLRSEPIELQLSGRSLHRFAVTFAMQLPPPMKAVKGNGVSYFDAPTGVFFDGELEFDGKALLSEISSKPAAIILPGEPGFDEPFPTYDCGDISLNLMDEKADRS